MGQPFWLPDDRGRGVASWAFVFTLRAKVKKQSLIAHQGSYEPFLLKAFADLERWIGQNPNASELLREMHAA